MARIADLTAPPTQTFTASHNMPKKAAIGVIRE
jgi:hypothetical protein